MLFNSIQFLLFFPLVTILYYLFNYKWRWLLLLVASCYFYAALIPAYLLVLFAVILIDYVAGIFIEKGVGPAKKKYLIISIVANVGILCLFKYYNFFIENVDSALALIHIKINPFPFLKLALPIGLSFHTFQAMSYTIEVYKGNQKAERHLGIYALYVMFYPQMVAGPIERPQKMLHQFYEKHPLNFDNISAGLKTMLWGYFLKVVLADRLGIYVDSVYANIDMHSKLGLLVAMVFYSFQIYGDFAGYSLIAIGAARTMGFRLSKNFNQPYLSPSIKKFWQRWHITLSTWFRDYVYFPLGGNRVDKFQFFFNILITFILSGLWHGANWTFIVWALLHALFMLIEMLLNKLKPNIGVPIFSNIFVLILVTASWVFFRSSSISQALAIFSRLCSNATPWTIINEFKIDDLLRFSITAIIICLLADVKWKFFYNKRLLFYHHNRSIRIAACIVMVVVILLFGVFDQERFIYFQF